MAFIELIKRPTVELEFKTMEPLPQEVIGKEYFISTRILGPQVS